MIVWTWQRCQIAVPLSKASDSRWKSCGGAWQLPCEYVSESNERVVFCFFCLFLNVIRINSRNLLRDMWSPWWREHWPSGHIAPFHPSDLCSIRLEPNAPVCPIRKWRGVSGWFRIKVIASKVQLGCMCLSATRWHPADGCPQQAAACRLRPVTSPLAGQSSPSLLMNVESAPLFTRLRSQSSQQR